ncbi:MAG: universal stress protein [Rhodoferax sp.]
MKILLAVDGSAFSKKMLAYLGTHEALLSAQHSYTLLTVQPALPPHASAAVGKEVAQAYYAEESEKVLAPLGEFLLRHGIHAKSLWKAGHAGELIGKEADEGHYDMVVMGSHGHSALANLVMGSVTTQVLAHCKVPVLLVR